MMKKKQKKKIFIPKLDLIENKEELIIPNKNKLKKNFTITHYNSEKHCNLNNFNNNKLNIFNSNDDLPKINKHFDRSLSNSSNTKDSYSKDKKIIFLKSNYKSLNPVKVKKYINIKITDKEKYLLNSNSKDDIKPKDELKTMKKSLFYDGSVNKYFMKTNFFEIMNKNGKKKLSNFIPKLSNENYIKEEINKFEINEEKKKSDKMFIRNKFKSNRKLINNLAGKETKLYIANKRNLSNQQLNRITFKK